MRRRKQGVEQQMKERLLKIAGEARRAALILPPGRQREMLLTKAQQTETAAQIDEWLSSPGLRPPT